MQKCYGVTITGKVQDIGFRDLIENIGRSHYLNGIVFNETIGSSVKIVCRGDYSVINDFFDEIKTKGSKVGIVFDITDKKELPLEIPLPEKFTKVSADDVEDNGRKLDKGNSELKGINTKLLSVDNRLIGIGEDTHNLVVDQRDFNKEMRDYNHWMKENLIETRGHNQNLEKILEKLSERYNP